jgi:hypothetical protein
MGFMMSVQKATPKQVAYLVDNYSWIPFPNRAVDGRNLDEIEKWAKRLTKRGATRIISQIIDEKVADEDEPWYDLDIW